METPTTQNAHAGTTDKITTFDCEQGTPEWHAARAGIITASELSDVLAGGDGAVRRKYMWYLAWETLNGRPYPEYWGGNKYTRRGHEKEPEARELFAQKTGLPVTQVGFIRNDMVGMGCSPDALIGDDAGLEIKTKEPHIHGYVLESQRIPPEHIAQIEGCLLVTGRAKWYFMSYCEGFPPVILCHTLTPERAQALKSAINLFRAETTLLVNKVKKLY